MPALFRLLFRRTSLALRTWPSLLDWQVTFLIFAAFGTASLLIGFSTGFLTWKLTDLPPTTFAFTSAVLLLAPGLFEETVFRAWLLPHPSERRPEHFQISAVVWSVVLFTLWHLFSAWLLLPGARPIFWDWRFLLIVVFLGTSCASVYLRTGSLYPAILVHWSIVVVWKACLGGAIFFD